MSIAIFIIPAATAISTGLILAAWTLIKTCSDEVMLGVGTSKISSSDGWQYCLAPKARIVAGLFDMFEISEEMDLQELRSSGMKSG